MNNHKSLIPGLLFLTACCLALLSLPQTAAAHDDLISSSPAAGAVLAEPPQEIRLTFSGQIAPESTFTVFEAGFQPVEAQVIVDKEDPTVLVGRDLQFPGEGEYTVQWEVVSSDGHALTGSFIFFIGDESMMPLIAAATESTAFNPPGWSAWLMIALALISAFLVARMARK